MLGTLCIYWIETVKDRTRWEERQLWHDTQQRLRSNGCTAWALTFRLRRSPTEYPWLWLWNRLFRHWFTPPRISTLRQLMRTRFRGFAHRKNVEGPCSHFQVIQIQLYSWKSFREYITPSRLKKKIVPSASDLCWHGCGHVGTLILMLWHCLQCFWTVFRSI